MRSHVVISSNTAIRHLQVIRELEAKPQPLCEFEQKRLETMKREVKEIQDAVASGRVRIEGVSETASELIQFFLSENLHF